MSAPMSAPKWDVQQAIYAVLTADAILMSKITGVFDEAPDAQPFDYVSIGEATDTGDDTFNSLGSQLTVTLHIWSRGHGFKQALAIEADLYRLLHRATLPLADHVSVACLYDYSECLRDPDGLTRHVPWRLRVWVRGS